VKIRGFVSRIVQKFGPLPRLPIVFNVNQRQEKRTAFADTGTPRKEVSINHGFSDGRHASRPVINRHDLREIHCVRMRSRKTFRSFLSTEWSNGCPHQYPVLLGMAQ
jgi:hypothetical protein